MNDRGRNSRHPIQLALFASLVGIGTAQLLFGAGGSRPVLAMPLAAQQTFSGLLVFGALLVLLGGLLPPPRVYWIELGGQVGCAIALTTYTLTLKDTIPQWTTSMASGFGFVAVGCLVRVGYLTVLIVANFYPALFRRLARAYITLRIDR